MQSESYPVLAVSAATKSFGAVQALRGVSFELRSGELLALLGPNGAGKTTLIRAIAGRVRLDSGSIELFGEPDNSSEGRKELSVVPQELAIYPLLTARENLDAFARLCGLDASKVSAKVEWALKWIDLEDRANEPVRNFSGGMKRRLNIACSVLHEPRIVLLDEPTVGVDPQSREKIYDMLDELRRGGMSLVLTTHHLEEAEARCERIVIIDHGTVVAAGTLNELVAQTIGHDRLLIITPDKIPAHLPDGFELFNGGKSLSTSVRQVAAELPELLARVQQAGCRIDNVELRAPSLQAVFIHLTGKELRE